MRIKHDSGMAIILALIGLIIIGTLTLGIIEFARKASTVTAVEIERAQSEALTEGALHAVWPLLASADANEIIRDKNGIIETNLETHKMSVSISDACGYWDVNSGDIEILKELMTYLDIKSSHHVTKLFIQMREKGFIFQNLNQIHALPNVNRDSMSKLLPNMTVFCGAREIDPFFATSDLKKILPSLSPETVAPGPGKVFRISTSNKFGAGSFVSLLVHVSITGDPKQPLRILDWRSRD